MVLICSGDPVVGRALESLLRAADYAVEYVADDLLTRPGSLEGVRVLLLSARWDARSRDVVLRAAGNAVGRTGDISILELGEPSDGSKIQPENYVPWPCRTEVLTRRIDALTMIDPRSGVGLKSEGGRT